MHTPESCVDSKLNPTLEQTSFRLGSLGTIAAQLLTFQNADGNTFRTPFRVADFGTVHSRYFFTGQNRYPKPMTEIANKRNGQWSKTRSSRCLRRVRLEFGDVPTAATRIGAIVYAKFVLLTRRQFAPTMAGVPFFRTSMCESWTCCSLPANPRCSTFIPMTASLCS